MRSKNRGTPAAAVLAHGIRGHRDEPLTSIATRNVGDLVELVEPTNYGGTQSPTYLPAGTRVVVSAHCGNPVENVLVTVPGAPSWVAYISPSTTVRIVKVYQAGNVLGGTAEVDPLIGGAQ